MDKRKDHHYTLTEECIIKIEKRFINIKENILT